VKRLDRQQWVALAALFVLLLACGGVLALSVASRLEAAQEQADQQDVLSRLEARLHARTGAHGELKPASAPAQAFLDAPTPGLAGADLQAYVERLADRHAALVSFGVQGGDNDRVADTVGLETSMDITLNALQVLLHQLESGTPYVFVDSLSVHTAAGLRAAADTLRVTLGLRALWRGPRHD
jgi:general secretion pathway protein M